MRWMISGLFFLLSLLSRLFFEFNEYAACVCWVEKDDWVPFATWGWGVREGPDSLSLDLFRLCLNGLSLEGDVV